MIMIVVFMIMGLFGLVLAPNRFELVVDQPGRQLEIMGFGQRIQQRSLQPHARNHRISLLHVLGDGLAQGGQVIEAQILRQLIVGSHRNLLVHFLDIDGEFRGFSRQILGAVIIGEFQREFDVIARLAPHQVFLETGNEAAFAEHDREILGGAAVEGDIIQGAGKIDDELIAVFGRQRFGRRRIAFMASGELSDRLIQRFVVDRNLKALELQGRKIHGLEFGEQIDRHRVFEIAPLIEGGDLDFRLTGRLQRALADRRVRAFGDGAFQNLAHDRCGIALAQHGYWDLAGPKSRQADFAAQLLEPVGELPLDIGSRDDDFEFAPQAFAFCFRYLHERIFSDLSMPRIRGEPVGAGGGT